MQTQHASTDADCAGQAKPQPFNVSYNFEVAPSMQSASDLRATSCTKLGPNSSQCLCSCGSLSEWGSLQLQEQHLLGANKKNGQDMVVVVLTRSDNEAAAQAEGGAVEKPKPQPRLSSEGDHTARQSTGGNSTAHTRKGCCHQNPRQLTQEVCLRLLALLLVVLATVGLAYRLAKRDS